ncbi:hypothetical protein SEA_NEDARYA_40 [Gordonia phage Nedarya]|nr:hypothetical protein SEA_NEDARYA_40 [Gordonia phage Nedarya]
MAVRYYDEDWNLIEDPTEVSDFLYEDDDDYNYDNLSCGCCSCCGCMCDYDLDDLCDDPDCEECI